MEKQEYERLLTDGWIPGKDYVFVSYASRDWEQVYQTVLALRAKGINVYIDVEFRENQTHNWIENIKKRILQDTDCCGMVTFLSIDYMRSYACLMEQLANMNRDTFYIMGGARPVFYIALESQMCSSQQMKSYIYDRECARESRSRPVNPTEEERGLLRRLILTMDPSCGKYSEEDVDDFFRLFTNGHIAALKMYDLVFKMPTLSFQKFQDPKDCAELLFRNFTGAKNQDINMAVDEELVRETMSRLQKAGLAPAVSPAPAAPQVVTAPAPAPIAPQAAPVPAPDPIPATFQAVPKSTVLHAVPKPVLVTEIPQAQPKRRGRPPRNPQAPAGAPEAPSAPVPAPQLASPAVTAIQGPLPEVTIGEIRKLFMTEEFCCKAGELRKGKDNLPYGGKGALDYGMAAILGGCNSVKQPWQINYYNFAVANMEKKTGAKMGATWTWSSNCRKVLGLEKSGMIPAERDEFFASLPEDTLFGDIVAAFEKGDFPYDTAKNDVIVECLRRFATLL